MAIVDNIRFRAATTQDIPALCDLLESLFTLEADFRPDQVRQARALELLIARSAARTPADCRVWVAEHDSRVIGMCSMQVTVSTAKGGEVGWIEDVILHADYRRQGVGRAMLQVVESWARVRGLLRLQLLVDSHNQPALDFYRQNDWSDTRLQARFKHLSV